jgi:putative flippase GtrA
MSQFVKFVIAGGFAACVNIACRYVLDIFISYDLAIVIAYLIAMFLAYGLSRAFVFEKTGAKIGMETLKFVMVNAVSIVLVWLTSIAFARHIFPAIGFTWHSDDIAHMIGVMVPAVSSYLGHKYFTFGTKHA